MEAMQVDMLNRQNVKIHIFNRLFARPHRSFTLRMAPMIDMTFLLLIFFLVAAKWRPKEDFLPFQLPTARGQTLRIGKPEPLIIQIAAIADGCEVQIGQSRRAGIENQTIEENLAMLARRVNDTLIEQKRYAADPVEIICAPDVKWDHLAKIYNLLYAMGLTDITFRMTEQLPNDRLD